MLEREGAQEAARRGRQMSWATGGEKEILPTAAKVRRDAVRLMREFHEEAGGSHHGRTWDKSEVVPRRNGVSVIVRSEAGAMDGERGRAGGAPVGSGPSRREAGEEGAEGGARRGGRRGGVRGRVGG